MIIRYVRLLSLVIVTFLWVSNTAAPAQAACGPDGTTNCNLFNCNGFNGSPCTTNGGCCRGGMGGTCVDPLIATPGPGLLCATPTQAPTGPTQTPTIPSGPPTAPPTAPPTQPPATPTPGISCQIGNSSACPAGNTCRCGYAGQDFTSCTQGNCWPIVNSTPCGPNPGPNCAGNEDCSRMCGGTTAECRSGRCWDDGVVDDSIAPCVAPGVSCVPSGSCVNDGVTRCDQISGLRCTETGTVCCRQQSCPEDSPVGFVFRCGPSDEGVSTAFGCITNPATDIFGHIVRIASALAGGISFLLILFGSFQIIVSAGNPERLAAGRELVTSAVTGLLLVLFSVFILSFLGVQLFQIPGFTQ